jgi:hypothetical protein
MSARSRKWRIALGISLLVIGFAGLGLPLIQGLLFIVLGVLILSQEIPFFARIAKWMKKSFPKTAKAA